MFLTRLTQRDARSQNVVKSPGYCIKQIDFILPWVCTLITHRGRQNMVRTSVTLPACGSWRTSLFLPCFDVICALSEYRRTANEIYLLNMARAMLDIESPFSLFYQFIENTQNVTIKPVNSPISGRSLKAILYCT